MKPLQALAVTGASGNGAQLHKWELGLVAYGWMWLEDVVESSGVAGGYESLGPRYNLSHSLIHDTWCHPSYIPISTRAFLSLLLPQSQWLLSALPVCLFQPFIFLFTFIPGEETLPVNISGAVATRDKWPVIHWFAFHRRDLFIVCGDCWKQQ